VKVVGHSKKMWKLLIIRAFHFNTSTCRPFHRERANVDRPLGTGIFSTQKTTPFLFPHAKLKHHVQPVFLFPQTLHTYSPL